MNKRIKKKHEVQMRAELASRLALKVTEMHIALGVRVEELEARVKELQEADTRTEELARLALRQANLLEEQEAAIAALRAEADKPTGLRRLIGW